MTWSAASAASAAVIPGRRRRTRSALRLRSPKLAGRINSSDLRLAASARFSLIRVELARSPCASSRNAPSAGKAARGASPAASRSKYSATAAAPGRSATTSCAIACRASRAAPSMGAGGSIRARIPRVSTFSMRSPGATFSNELSDWRSATLLPSQITRHTPSGCVLRRPVPETPSRARSPNRCGEFEWTASAGRQLPFQAVAMLFAMSSATPSTRTYLLSPGSRRMYSVRAAPILALILSRVVPVLQR